MEKQADEAGAHQRATKLCAQCCEQAASVPPAKLAVSGSMPPHVRFGLMYVMVTLVTLASHLAWAPGGLRKEQVFRCSSATERGLEWA